ncbi:MAG: serine/threonine-protein kinase, partial [Vicinamibacterales bacterium]
GPYEVVAEIGRGGMGEVYRARDTKLDRDVALKVLPQAFTDDPDRLARFEREAKVLASLNHPNICTLHDIGQHDGRPFIVMEVVQGDTLRKRLQRGRLDSSQSIDFGIQLADALDAAHGKGVIHRDIKPANIVITDRGQAKLLDFGLAKLAPHAEAQSTGAHAAAPTIDAGQLTNPRTVVGTLSYMSPEQARGEELDGRSDLFSLGTVLYEMVTGQRAFPGQMSAVIFDAILNRAPTPPVHFAPDVPMRLGKIINNATEKNRDLRYQTAAELRADLRRARRDLDSSRSVSLSASAFAGVHVAPSGATSQTAAGVPETPLASGPAGSGPTPAPSARGRVWGYGACGLVAAALVAALFFPSDPSPEVPQVDRITALAQAQLAQATESLARRDYESAIAQADAALALQPDDADAQRVRSAAVAALESQPSPASVSETVRDAAESDPAPITSVSPVAQEPQDPAAPEPQRMPAAPAQTTTPPPATAPPVTPEPVDVTPVTPEPVPEPEPTAIVTPEIAPPPPDDPPVTQPTTASDEAAIRRVLDDFARATETKDVELYRSVRPISTEEERRLRSGFDAVETQQVELLIESIEITGDRASVQGSRQDTFVGADGQKQTRQSNLSITLTRQDRGWVITEITN